MSQYIVAHELRYLWPNNHISTNKQITGVVKNLKLLCHEDITTWDEVLKMKKFKPEQFQALINEYTMLIGDIPTGDLVKSRQLWKFCIVKDMIRIGFLSMCKQNNIMNTNDVSKAYEQLLEKWHILQ